MKLKIRNEGVKITAVWERLCGVQLPQLLGLHICVLQDGKEVKLQAPVSHGPAKSLLIFSLCPAPQAHGSSPPSLRELLSPGLHKASSYFPTPRLIPSIAGSQNAFVFCFFQVVGFLPRERLLSTTHRNVGKSSCFCGALLSFLGDYQSVCKHRKEKQAVVSTV